MKTKSSFFKEVYFIDDVCNVSDNQMENLLMCGNKNWDHYFDFVSDEVRKNEVEKIKNVELVEFDSEKNMFDFLKNIDEKSMINFSTQHEKPCVLKFA